MIVILRLYGARALGVRYRKLEVNFDGSTTIELPQVHFKRAFRVIGSFAILKEIAEVAANTCALFEQGSLGKSDVAISIDSKGRTGSVIHRKEPRPVI